MEKDVFIKYKFKWIISSLFHQTYRQKMFLVEKMISKFSFALKYLWEVPKCVQL